MSEYDNNSRVDEILRKIRQERGEASADTVSRASSIKTSSDISSSQGEESLQDRIARIREQIGALKREAAKLEETEAPRAEVESKPEPAPVSEPVPEPEPEPVAIPEPEPEPVQVKTEKADEIIASVRERTQEINAVTQEQLKSETEPEIQIPVKPQIDPEPYEKAVVPSEPDLKFADTVTGVQT